jgi:hypothetical protein
MTTVCELTEVEVEHVRALSKLRVMQTSLPFRRKFKTVYVARQEPMPEHLTLRAELWPDGWN